MPKQYFKDMVLADDGLLEKVGYVYEYQEVKRLKGLKTLSRSIITESDLDYLANKFEDYNLPTRLPEGNCA